MAHKWARWLDKPLPPGGSPLLHIGGQSQRWPISGRGGYITPAARGVPTVSKRGEQSQVAHKWARWLHNPCCPGGPHRFREEGTIRAGPSSGQGGYMTPAAWGVPTASDGWAESKVGHNWARWLHNPCCRGGPHRFRAEAQSDVARKWARSLHNRCRLESPHRFRAGDKISGDPQVGDVAT